jgi:hypothetical protein
MKWKLIPALILILFTQFVYAELPDGFVDVDEMRRAFGLSVNAAKPYEKEHGFAVSGYVETLFQSYSSTVHWIPTNIHPVAEDFPSHKDAEFPLNRAVLFAGYRWSDKLVINSEFRVDRDGLERGLATFPALYDTTHIDTNFNVDLAYADYIVNRSFVIRGGIILVPMGLINEMHTPQEYLGTRTGYADIYTIPAIWHALGIGFAGRKGSFNYRGYVINSLNPTNFTEMGWRAGREITWDTISHPALVGRIDWNPSPLGSLGGSYYWARPQVYGLENNFDQTFRTDMMEFHGEFHWLGAFARAEYAKGLVENSPQLNLILQTKNLNGIGKRIVGGYVEGGWNILYKNSNGKMIMPYMRGEAANSQDALPPQSLALGLLKNHYVDFIIWTWGVEIRPIRELSIKAEYVAPHDQYQIFWKEFHLGASYTF